LGALDALGGAPPGVAVEACGELGALPMLPWIPAARLGSRALRNSLF